ncbi:DHA1 family bicyclomycin/chloramphenicol resistance-like MFS transporter [Bradyrhizobium algeriense]|uniref:Bcr/CflA family efflux transporter n=1 Tax=Bradyrhizobium algeriense TaxID=634784 RepID=A0ABU8BIS3_9BRAD
MPGDDGGGSRERSGLTAYLILISVLGMVPIDIFLPAVPAMADAFGLPAARIQEVFPAYFIGVAVAQFCCGPLSDHYGRRPVLVGALILMSVGALIAAVAPTFSMMLLGRFVQGVGCGVAIVLWRSIAFDLLDEPAAFRMIATVLPAIVVSPAIAPVLGGFLLVSFGWRSIFGVLAAISVGALFVTLLTFDESLQHKVREHILAKVRSSYQRLALSPSFWRLIWLVCTAYSAYFLYIAQSPLLFTALGFRPEVFSLFYIPVAAGFFAGSRLARNLRESRSSEYLLILGTCLFAAGGTIIVLFCVARATQTAATLIFGFCLVVIGNGITLAIGSAKIMAEFRSIAGTASATIGLLQALSTMVLTVVLSRMNEASEPFWSMATMFGLCILSIVAACHSAVNCGPVKVEKVEAES